jgi:cystathionine gamma-synthase
MKIQTLAVHAGHHVDPGSGAIAPPLIMSTTFERAANGSYPNGHIYTRASNPNREALEEALAALEGGTVAAAFASGSAATMSVFQALSPGDHVIAPDDLYHGTARILRSIFDGWGLEASFVDMTDVAAVEAAIKRNTKVVWIETPSNPQLKITDIEAVSALAHDAGARVVCDNTWATPVVQRPFDLGVDLVLHSTTKYLGGHSDVLGGAVIAKTEDDLWERIRALQTVGGAVPSPFDCWLLLRSLPTLPLRMEAHCRNAQQIAAFLYEHPQIEQVHYPGLPDDPYHDLAVRQMCSFGGMISCRVRGGQQEALAVTAKAKLWTRATSLGGVESLIEHRASIEGPETRTPQNLLRLSVGIEHADDLIADLEQALG